MLSTKMDKTIYQKLLEAQKEIGAIKRDSDNPYFKSKYFDINAILREVKPILNKHGLLLTQSLYLIEGRNGLITCIIDADTPTLITMGEVGIVSKLFLPEGLDPQKMGSAITYFRRYALQSLLALEATDDDGNSASTPKPKKEMIIQTKDKNTKVFFQDMKPTVEDLIAYQEKLESARDKKELKLIWENTPPLVKDELKSVKDRLKEQLK